MSALKHNLIAATVSLFATSAAASIEWSVLYALRAVEFTTALVNQCNADFPRQAEARLSALDGWKAKNEPTAKVVRAFNLARARAEGGPLSEESLERDLRGLEASALQQAGLGGWARMCLEMPQWLSSEQSDVLRQLPPFMHP